MSIRRANRPYFHGRPFGKEKGFSLPELLIAVAIFSVGMLGIGSMLMASIQNDKLNMSKRRGEDIAMDIAERFKAHNPDEWSESGTRRWVYHSDDPLTAGETGQEDLSAMLFDWQVLICRGCEDGSTECVPMLNGLPETSFTCSPRSTSEAELDTRQVEIWVGWGPFFSSTGEDPLGKCTDLSVPAAKCRKKRTRVRTYGYEK